MPGSSPGCTANATASEPVPAATALPVWAGLPVQPSSPQTLQAIDGTPLFLTTCGGCAGAACPRLHRRVLPRCC